MPAVTLPAPQCLIFDLDGTLVDSFADIANALNGTRGRYGLPPLALAEVKRHVGSGSAYLVKTLVPVAVQHAEEAFLDYLARYGENPCAESRPYPGVEAVLRHYAGRRLAVVTNKPIRLAAQVLEILHLRQSFQMVLGGDSLAHSKPHPLPLLHVLAAFSVAPAAGVMIGDGLHDIEAGRAAGLRTVGVTTGVATRAELESAGPDHLIDSLEALPALLG